MEPLPTTTSGNSYIIVATEALTRWPIAKAVPSADADEAAKFFYEEIVLQFGPPDTILTDRGTHFLNLTMERITEHLETHHLRTTAYHPQANGMTERFNGTLCTMLSKISERNIDDWDLYIPAALYAYRIRTHTALGKSPFEAMYGQIPKMANGALLGPESFDEAERINNQNGHSTTGQTSPSEEEKHLRTRTTSHVESGPTTKQDGASPVWPIYHYVLRT